MKQAVKRIIDLAMIILLPLLMAEIIVGQEIQLQTGADIFEIELVHPYSDDYDTVLDQAQHDQNIQARPEIKNTVQNFEQYDTVILGYPNWWASIPMPIASFLEEYDLSGKTIIPFCSHGGGRFGQSLTAIANSLQMPLWVNRCRCIIRAMMIFRRKLRSGLKKTT